MRPQTAAQRSAASPFLATGHALSALTHAKTANVYPQVAHGNTARFAKDHGDELLAKAREAAASHWKHRTGAPPDREPVSQHRKRGYFAPLQSCPRELAAAFPPLRFPPLSQPGPHASPTLRNSPHPAAQMCGLIAADEGRHEIAYQRIIDEVFVRDPNGAMLAFADMMKKQIVMPAHMMDDNEHRARTGRDLFHDYSEVAERTGVYTALDYVDIMEHLVKRWDIEHRTVTGEAQAAQDYLMEQPARFRKLIAFANRKKEAAAAKGAATKEKFSWIFNREAQM